ncbi:hypothetical protein K438DRAFT_1508275, partial [Mycena galopus ATCC 62051]
TNEPPRDAEFAVLRPVADKTAARLACLEAEIRRLKDQLDQLEEEHAGLLTYHHQNTSILSPLRRFPPEILGEIFLQTLPSIHKILNVKDSPWPLTHVCSRWRAIALSKPSLWSM